MSGRQCPSNRQCAGAVNSSHGHCPPLKVLCKPMGDRGLWFPYPSLQKDVSKNKGAGGPPTLRHSGPQTSAVFFFTPPCDQATPASISFPNYWDLHQLQDTLF